MPAVQNIRTLALLGHAGAGKTTLIENLLALSGAILQPGSVEKGTTVCDYDPLEKEHQHSAKLSVACLDCGELRVQMLDTPGFPDFAGQAMAALDATETVMTVINPQNGIKISASRAMLWAQTRKLCRVLVVNRIDAERLNGIDHLQHALDLRPAGQAQQNLTAGRHIRNGRAALSQCDRAQDVDARNDRAKVVGGPPDEGKDAAWRE